MKFRGGVIGNIPDSESGDSRFDPWPRRFKKKGINTKRTAYLDKGYWIVWRKNNSRTQLHRWIMEQVLGRRLKNTEVVHHKNGNKTDNHVRNLEVLSVSKHCSHHSRRPFDQVYARRRCKYCKAKFFVAKRYLRSPGNTPRIYCGRSCGAKAQWDRGAAWISRRSNVD